jgi:polyketide synthase PksN
MNGASSLSVHQSETTIESGKALMNGYAQTKWVSEHHLLQAHNRGIPVTIFRCGEISGSSQTGYGMAKDMFHNFLSIFSKAETVPQWDNGVMDMVPIDYVCRTIFAISQQSNCYGKIYHLTHPNPIPIRNFFDFLLQKNPSLTRVSFEKFADGCLHYIHKLPESSVRSILLPYFAKMVLVLKCLNIIFKTRA